MAPWHLDERKKAVGPVTDASWVLVEDILWMDGILHQIEPMKNQCLLAFTGESSFPGFLGGAGFRPSAVGVRFSVVLIEIDGTGMIGFIPFARAIYSCSS